MSEDPRQLAAQAEEKLEEGELDEALNLYDRAVYLAPTDESLKEGLAKVQKAVEKEDAAKRKKKRKAKKKKKAMKQLQAAMQLVEAKGVDLPPELSKVLVGGKSTKTKEKTMSVKEYIPQQLDKMKDDLEENKYKKCKVRVEKFLEKIEEDPEVGSELTADEIKVYVAKAHSYLGTALLELDELEEALEAHTKDLELSTELGYQEDRARALTNIGLVYSFNETFEDAITAWSEAVSLTTDPVEKAWIYHEMGKCFFESGDIDEAITFAELAKEDSQHSEDKTVFMNAYILIARCKEEQGNDERAIECYRDVFAVALREGDKDAEEDILDRVAEIDPVDYCGLKGLATIPLP